MELPSNLDAIRPHLLSGGFGLEKESLRVTPAGFLSHTLHPFPNDPNIERDFCENQVELITPVCDSPKAVCDALRQLQDQVLSTLYDLPSGKEYLWPFSNPPYVKGEEDIPVAVFSGALKGKERYRQYLAQKYGKHKMLYSGIHFNFSFSEALLQQLYCGPAEGYRDWKDGIYLDLAKKATKYSWLIVYLTAASPLLDSSFFDEATMGQEVYGRYSSYRCGRMGYWNDFLPILSFDSLSAYTHSIQKYIDDGQLHAASELYYPIRLKPAGDNSLAHLEQSGVNHIELRTIDLNPFSDYCILLEDVQFLHYFLLYLFFQPSLSFGLAEQVIAIQNEKRAATYDVSAIDIEVEWGRSQNILEAGLDVLRDVQAFYQRLQLPEAVAVIAGQMEKLQNPDTRYAARVQREFLGHWISGGLALAEEYALHSKKRWSHV